MGAHLINGHFQSDKFPSTPSDLVPLSTYDKDAQDLLWLYADRHRTIDPEFSDDLQDALRLSGYEPDSTELIVDQVAVDTARAALAAGRAAREMTATAVDTAMTHGRRWFESAVRHGGDWVGRGGKPKDKE